jgi:hypothetical protein
MYKKTMLASSIALASGVASAASWVTDLGVTAVEHTKQGIDKSDEATGVVTSNAVVRLNSVYAPNDTITFTYNIAKATNYNWPVSLYSIGTYSGTAGVLEINGALAAGVTALTMVTTSDGTTAGQTGVKVGDRLTIENDATSTVQRVTSIANPAGTVLVTPGIPTGETTTDADDITFTKTKSIELGLINSSDTSVTYRVVTVTDNGSGSTVGAEIPVPAPNVSPDALEAAGSATVSFSASTATGVAMDTLATSADIATASEEFVWTITKLDGVIDVETDKIDFASNADNSAVNNDTEDKFVLALTQDAGTAGVKVSTDNSGVLTLGTGVTQVTTTTDAAVHTVTGDFSFLDNATTAGVTMSAAAVVCSNLDADEAVNTAGTELTLTDNSTMATTQTCHIRNDQGAAMTPQDYTYSTVVTYTSNSTTNTKTFSGSLGSWTLNGASINVYGVPFGSTTSRFLTVGNKGAAAATISGTVEYDGTSYGPYTLATVASKASSAVAPLWTQRSRAQV